jgi:ABC-type antimicrobial peptide transport system permease subunit
VRALVLRHAAVVVGTGVAAGFAGAVAMGRSLQSLVFDTSPWDPRVFLATAALLALVALVSAWLPARRAARVEPRIAMGEA